MQDLEFIDFEGPWSDEDRRCVLRHLEALPCRRHLDRMSSTKVSFLAPVWKFELNLLNTGSTIYLVSSLVFNIFTAAPSLPRLLGKVENTLQEHHPFGRE